MADVSLAGVSKLYPGGAGLHPIDLTLPAGDRVAVVGPSGSGKTTLLRLIAGLETPDAGTVRIAGRDVSGVPPHKRNVALAAQRPALYPHLTVAQNLRVPSPSADIAPAVELLRLGPLLTRYPHQLSGGEQQRAALAKLLVRNAGVWLLDEPFAGLDPPFRAEFRHEVHLLLGRTAATMLFVTHDPADALALGRRIGVLADGRLRHLGPPEELLSTPADTAVARSLGRFNLLAGVVDGGDPAGTTFRTAGGVAVPLPGKPPDDNLTLGFRPDDVSHVTAGPPGEWVTLREWAVISAEPDGRGWTLALTRATARLRVGWPSSSPPPVGVPREWYLNAGRCVWFDGTGRRITWPASA